MSSVEHITTEISATIGALPDHEIPEAQVAIAGGIALLMANGEGSTALQQVTELLETANDRLSAAGQYLAAAKGQLHSYLEVICAEGLNATATQATAAAKAETKDSPVPMSALRPDWVLRAIDETYHAMPGASPRFVQNGKYNTYVFGSSTAAEYIATYRRDTHDNGSLRILDIGTGAGGFITLNNWQPEDIVQGITAMDYRGNSVYAAVTPAEDDPRYIIGNAEHLDTIPDLLPEYDVIVSKFTIQHFVDRLGSLEQIANRLAPGGLLCVHVDVGIKGLSPEDIAGLLEQQGFVLVSDEDALLNGDIIMTRGSEAPVRFNYGYHRTQEVVNPAAQGGHPERARLRYVTVPPTA